MKIDWKQVSASPAYKSLKLACIQDIQRKARSKTESRKFFYWVIGRAQHYSHVTGKSIIEILDAWESNRSYWWLNYYQEHNMKKILEVKKSL